jgi:hypothetical protein
MSWARRALRAFTWRHLGVALALGAAWPIVRRIGTVRNNVDAFAADVWGYEIVFCMVCGLLCAMAIVLAESRQPSRAGPTTPEYALAFALAAAAFTLVAIFVLPPWPLGQAGSREGRRFIELVARFGWDNHPLMIAISCARALMFAAFATAFYVWLRRARIARHALEDALLTRAKAQRTLARARLAAARGSVEPEEVLRRLEAIEAACATDTARAEAMLDDLIDFLRAAVPRLRADALPEAPA